MRSQAENPADDRTFVELAAYRVRRGDHLVTVTQDDDGKWRLSGRAVTIAGDVVRSVEFQAAGGRVGSPVLFAFDAPQLAQDAAAQLLNVVITHQRALAAADAALVGAVRDLKPTAPATLSVASGKD